MTDNLTNEQQEVVRQTERIARKNHALEVLYDVAASINVATSLEDLLLRFLPTLKTVLQAESVTVRLTNFDGQMRLIGSIGLENTADIVEPLIPVLHCMYGSDLQEGQLLSQDKFLRCEIYPGQPFHGRDDITMIAVPLQYRNNNLGVYNVFVRKPDLLDREDIKDLLISIGRHLGIAIERAHAEAESKRLSIFRERSLISHELHDSLAQTLAALKFQIRTLYESLLQQADKAVLKEAELIKNGLDEAYSELRGLISHFRAPFDDRGLITAIETVIHQFRETAKISIYFQNEWGNIRFPSLHEMQIQRIIQEALANIRKHSHARSVRVMLGHNQDDSYSVLIEDDGVGLNQPLLGAHPGEQVGLTIMRERAQRIGGHLTIDSEHGEGTQIKLNFAIEHQSDLNNGVSSL